MYCSPAAVRRRRSSGLAGQQSRWNIERELSKKKQKKQQWRIIERGEHEQKTDKYLNERELVRGIF